MKTLRALGTGLTAVILSAGLATSSASASTARPSVHSVTVTAVRPLDVGSVCESTLPNEAITTINEIASGGPFPYPEDGEVFQNREGVLPQEPTGYYHEYTVVTPGSPTRGARRIVTGDDGSEYYTADHYVTFNLIDFTC